MGFIYISGYYNSEADFDQISLENNPSQGTNKENFVAKLDSNGNVLWAVPGGNQAYGCCDDRALVCMLLLLVMYILRVLFGVVIN